MKKRFSTNRRFILLAFSVLFGGLTILFLIGMGMFLWMGSWEHPLAMRPFGMMKFNKFALLIPFIFLVFAVILGRLGFHRYGQPFAEIMSASEAVAQGDLTIRVYEKGPAQLRNMIRGFNKMISELARSEQQRQNMTADIAHELRTPIHIIQGNIEGMIDGVYEPDKENLGVLLEETRLLSRLVSDLQTLSLSEAGQLPLHPTTFIVSDLLTDVVTSFSPYAAEQKVELQIGCNATLTLVADYDRLDQVLSNLVVNALHHTPAGGCIKLIAEKPAGNIRITVSDTGSGISAEDLPFIFDRFWKGDRSRTREGAGNSSGLGLAISRQLVRAHGGVISVTSESGKGTTFTIDLPGKIRNSHPVS